MSRVPESIAEEVTARSGGWCELRLPGCLGRADCHHHRQRRQIGGHTLANILHLDNANCHLARVHANPEKSYEMGWLVHSWDDPESVPVVQPWREAS